MVASLNTRGSSCWRVRFRVVMVLVLLWSGRADAVNGEDVRKDEPANHPIQIDCDFPGGNILYDRIDGDAVYLKQDPRDTEGFWFYWYFRIRGAEGRKLTFRFTDGNVVGVRGPAVSSDEGNTWQWLENGTVSQESFVYEFTGDQTAVRFCLAIPYQRSNFDRMVKRYANRDDFVVEDHAVSRKGREVPRIRFGNLGGRPKHRVLLACRHHSCEMMASWVLEGVIDTVLNGSNRGRWLRENVEFLCVPIMDYDGVEDGDQGKNRRPHDHNRDYLGEPVYPEVAALKDFVPEWSEGKLRLAIDLHCPYIRGGNNQELFFVGGPDEEMAKRLDAFSTILESVQTGPLRYNPEHNIPWGEAWNNMNEARSFGRWAALQPGIGLATTLETAYADAGGKPVTVESARALGADLAAAMEKWVRGEYD